MEVSCITVPPVFEDSIRVSHPPFVCGGNTNRPFLAKVRFIWAGSGSSPLDVEHWVELHPSRTQKPALGEEQIRDVDLDKSLIELPLRRGGPAVPSNPSRDCSVPNQSTSQGPDVTLKTDGQRHGIDYYLRLVLPDFPLTAEESKKRRHPPRLPYPVFARPDDLLAIPAGRRKAIEWARARSIRDACEKVSEGIEQPSIGTVFRWIQENAPLEKPIRYSNEKKGAESDAEQFCASCGISVASHYKTQVTEPSAGGSVCGTVISRLPLVDVNWWMRRPRQMEEGTGREPRLKEREVVWGCDPRLVVVAGRKLGEAEAGASALAGLVMEAYMRKVLRESVVVCQDLSRLVGTGGRRCLTASHVYRGMLQGAFKGGLGECLFTSVAEIGTGAVIT